MSSAAHQFETTVVLLGIVLGLVRLAHAVGVPAPVVMALVGLGISLVPGLAQVSFDPDLVLLVFLPPILYAAAWNMPWPEFRRNVRPISLLAFSLVFATIAAVALVAKVLVPGMPWAVAALLGAIVAPPDAIAATSVFERLPVPRRLLTIIEGESLVNDAGALVAYRVALAAILTGTFSLWTAAGQFVAAALGGLLAGIVFGAVVVAFHRRIKAPVAATLFSILTPYLIFFACERIHVSGVFAVVTAGIMLSRASPEVMTPVVRVSAIAVWDLLNLALNGLAFVLIGLQFRHVTLTAFERAGWSLLAFAAAISLAVVVARVAWVALTAPLATRGIGPWRSDPMPPSHHAVVAWAGMRGLISLAVALSLPRALPSGEPFPFRDFITFTAFAVILVTLVLQGLTLPLLLRRLRVGPPDGEVLEHSRAEQEGARVALRELGGAAARGAVPPLVAARLRAEYEARLGRLGEAASAGHGQCTAATILGPEVSLRTELRAVERKTLLHLRDEGDVGEATFRQVERRLDYEELAESTAPSDPSEGPATEAQPPG
jgi:monovalent cation/hydrogen antiporter